MDMQLKKRTDPAYMVIYNPMSAACVIAAAMIAASIKQVEVIKITDHLPFEDTFENGLKKTITYWVGVDPTKIQGLVRTPNSYYLPDDGTNVVYVDHTGNQVYLGQEEHDSHFPDGSSFTTLDKIGFLPGLEDAIPMADVGFLSHLAFDFQNPKRKTTEKTENEMNAEQIQASLSVGNRDMMLLYSNLKQAQWCLDGELPFVVNRTEIDDAFEQEYFRDVAFAKKRLNKNLIRNKVTDGKRIIDCSLTSFHDFTVHMALRLVRMADGDFANFTHSTSQPVVYTNIRGLVLDTNKYQAIKLEH